MFEFLAGPTGAIVVATGVAPCFGIIFHKARLGIHEGCGLGIASRGAAGGFLLLPELRQQLFLLLESQAP